jgi:hypothetical protein
MKSSQEKIGNVFELDKDEYDYLDTSTTDGSYEDVVAARHAAAEQVGSTDMFHDRLAVIDRKTGKRVVRKFSDIGNIAMGEGVVIDPRDIYGESTGQ